MCLYTYDTMPLHASRDMRVWKELVMLNNGSLITPIMMKKIHRIPTILWCKKKVECGPSYYEDLYMIEGGMIHAHMITERGIRQTLTDLSSDTNSVLVECVIPKGTPYFRGKHGDVCARKMKLCKIVAKGYREIVDYVFSIDKDSFDDCL